MKLMRNKYFKIILSSFLTLILFLGGIYLQNRLSQTEIKMQYYIASKRIEKGSLITEKDLSLLSTSDMNTSYIKTGNVSKITGKYATVNIEKGDFIMDSKFSLEKFEALGESEKLISLKVNPESAATWQFEIGQEVELQYTPTNHNVQEIHNPSAKPSYEYKKMLVTVMDYHNENLVSINSKDFVGIPTYVSVKGTDSDIEFISRSRDLGRFDFLIKK